LVYPYAENLFSLNLITKIAKTRHGYRKYNYGINIFIDEAVYDEDIIVISFDIRLSVETSTILSLFNSAVSLNLMTLNGTIIFDFKSEYERSTTSFVSTREHHICDGSWHRIKGNILIT